MSFKADSSMVFIFVSSFITYTLATIHTSDVCVHIKVGSDEQYWSDKVVTV